MADYKEMYLKMMRASEEAMRILIQAQQECEEMYLATEEDEKKGSPVQGELSSVCETEGL